VPGISGLKTLLVQQLIVSSLDFQTFQHVTSAQAKANYQSPMQQLAG
jgi:hypothetical protein